MKKKRIITHYGNMKLDELHTLAGKVLNCMKDHIIYTDLPMEIEALEDIIQDFRQKWESAKNGGSKWDNAVKDEAKSTLLAAFSRLATYVNQKADGHLPSLLSSGFELEKESSVLRNPSIPAMVALVDGPQSAQMKLKFKKVPYCWLYEYQYTHELDDHGQPVWGETIVSRNTLTNLIAPVIPGRTYYARVRARNGTGVSDWSAVVSLIAR